MLSIPSKIPDSRRATNLTLSLQNGGELLVRLSGVLQKFVKPTFEIVAYNAGYFERSVCQGFDKSVRQGLTC